MKKISIFMATIMFLLATVTFLGPKQEVQAFASSEIDYSDMDNFKSAKAGATVSFSCSLDYETAESVDVTGWKAALCPFDNKTLEAAVAVFDISASDKYISTEYKYADVWLARQLQADIPEGEYTQMFFDAAGNVVTESSTGYYINKELISVSCCLMNDDGYAYAYVYSENPALASIYPTLYAVDKETALTSFNDYTTEKNEYGDTVHVYRLNILDSSAFTLDSDGYTYFYYKMGTPNVITVSGSDAANDGGIGIWSSNPQGFGYTYIYNLNDVVERYDWDVEVTNPFDKALTDSESGSDTSSSSSHSSKPSATATVGGETVSASVSSIQKSDIPEVQAAIDNVINWVNQVTTQPAEVAKVLKRYAPAMKVQSVLAGGTLDLAVQNGVDISSGVRITFTDSSIAKNVKSGDKIIVLHVKHDGTIEYIPAEAGDGTITATFTSLSPVAWFKVDASGSGDSISPKTGISFWDFLMELFR